jgi:hypothetical protein
MSRPVLDTRYDIDGDLNDTQDALDGPPAARRWGSRLLAFALAAAAIYGACRGFHRYSATTDELAEVAAVTTPPDPKKLPTADDLGGLEPQQVITTWQQQNTQRIAADRTHLWSAYALMLLCPVTLGGAAVVWWRGQFKRPQGAATLDPTQLGMALTCAVMLAAVRGFDAYTLMNLDKMPPATDLKTAFYQVRDQRKPERFNILKSKLQGYVATVKDKTKKPNVRTDATKRIYAICARKEFADICPPAERTEVVATLTELIKANYADESISPLLIKSVGATGAVSEMASLSAEREKSKANWIDIKSTAALQCLYAAVTAGDEASVRKLIQRGIAVNLTVPGEGLTALHQAVALKNLPMTKLLLDGRARPDVAGKYGTARAVKEFPLHRAASVGDPQMVKLLLERGANPNVIDDGGLTPLHRAAALGDVAVAKVLLAGKAAANRLDKGGRTPIDVVEQLCTNEKKPAIRDLLEKNGGLTATKAVAAQATKVTAPAPVASTPRE